MSRNIDDRAFLSGMVSARISMPALICLTLLTFRPLQAGDPITIDGFFGDWAAVPAAQADTLGDGPQDDHAELRVTNDNSLLYLNLIFSSPEFLLRRQNSVTLYIEAELFEVPTTRRLLEW